MEKLELSNFFGLLSNKGYKIALKALIIYIPVSLVLGLIFNFNLYESRSILGIVTQGDLFSAITNAVPFGAFSIQGIKQGGTSIVESADFSGVMLTFRLMGLFVYSSLLSTIITSTIEQIDYIENSQERTANFFRNFRDNSITALPFSLVAGLLYFIINIPLGYLPDTVYYPICYIIKAPLLFFIVASVWTLAVEDTSDMNIIDRLKYCTEVAIDSAKYNIVPLLITTALVTVLMFIPAINMIVGMVWFILAPIYYSVLYYSTY